MKDTKTKLDESVKALMSTQAKAIPGAKKTTSLPTLKRQVSVSMAPEDEVRLDALADAVKARHGRRIGRSSAYRLALIMSDGRAPSSDEIAALDDLDNRRK